MAFCSNSSCHVIRSGAQMLVLGFRRLQQLFVRLITARTDQGIGDMVGCTIILNDTEIVNRFGSNRDGRLRNFLQGLRGSNLGDACA
jgi:hypothetical protein